MQLALSAWEDLEPDMQTPLGTWLKEHAPQAKAVSIPDGEVRLSDVSNFFDANTVYFGKKPPVSHVCASRVEAELIAAIARTGLRGPVSIPSKEQDCESLLASLETRLTNAASRFQELAQQYAGSDKTREQLVELLQRWFAQGKPA